MPQHDENFAEIIDPATGTKAQINLHLLSSVFSTMNCSNGARLEAFVNRLRDHLILSWNHNSLVPYEHIQEDYIILTSIAPYLQDLIINQQST